MSQGKDTVSRWCVLCRGDDLARSSPYNKQATSRKSKACQAPRGSATLTYDLMAPEAWVLRAFTAFLALLTCIQLAGCRTAALPDVQEKPTIDRPFIYIHQRKCGGSSMRDAVFAGATALGLNDSTFIPCYQGVRCLTSEPDPATVSTRTVLAGHFNWYSVVPGDRDYACLTTFRHPVSRVDSCISMVRHFMRKPVDLVANMTGEQFRQLLRTTHHGNASCNNEALYMLSGVEHAATLDFLAHSFHAAEPQIVQAISNMAKCTVLMIDEPSVPGAASHSNLSAWNARMMRHWFPWVKDVPHLHVNVHARIPAHLVPIVYEINWPEMKVYTAALRQYKAQQQALHSELPNVGVQFVDVPEDEWTPESVSSLRGGH